MNSLYHAAPHPSRLVGCLCSRLRLRRGIRRLGLLIALFVWVGWILIIPNIAPVIAKITVPTPTMQKINAEKEAIQREIQIRGERLSRTMLGYGSRAEKMWQELQEEGKRRSDRLDDFYDEKVRTQMTVTKTLSRLSPSASFTYAATGLAETADSWSVAVADYNGDGKLDIFVANDGQDALYRNNGDGTFTDVAEAAGIETAEAQGRAAAWGDFDSDGKVDLFIANVGADRLYKNNGDGSFTDVTTMAGMADTAVGAAAAWADYDQDGDLDLFVCNQGQDFLYRNNGNGTFNEAATHSGMTDMAVGAGAAWLDVNADGNPDVFVANADGDNFLYLNPGRSGPAPANIARRMFQQAGESLVSLVTRLATRLLG